MSRAEGGDEPHRGEGNPPRDDPIREPARRGGERDVEVGGERERRGALGVAVVGVPDPQRERVGGGAPRAQRTAQLLGEGAQLGGQHVTVVGLRAEGALGPQRLAPRRGLHRARVDPVGARVQHGAAAAEHALDLDAGEDGERADARHVVARQLVANRRVRARQRRERMRRQERRLLPRAHVHHRLGLQHVRRDLAHDLIPREPHRDGEPQPAPDLAPHPSRYVERRPEQLARTGEVAVGVAEGVRLDNGHEGPQDLLERRGGTAVEREPRRQEHQIGTAAQRLVDRHPHHDPRARRFGGGGPDDRPVGAAGRECHRPPREAGEDPALDSDRKRERIDVQDDALHGLPWALGERTCPNKYRKSRS